jgi:hypothetical protein
MGPWSRGVKRYRRRSLVNMLFMQLRINGNPKGTKKLEFLQICPSLFISTLFPLLSDLGAKLCHIPDDRGGYFGVG